MVNKKLVYFFRYVSFFSLQLFIVPIDAKSPKVDDFSMNSSPVSVETRFFDNAAYVVKKVLPNGMTILVREVHSIPKVAVQLWYEVGSKDEKDGEKGIAHLIEHMIFKGTKGKDSLNLSESDINVITHKLSGVANAFTAQDFTGYRFDFPTQHWHEALAIMADCMQHCAFEDDKLNSEMKAVIQELKMRRDNYDTDLILSVFSTMFPDHPYHYPIIGYKQDLWSVNGADLMKFYKKHYGPHNATLVVVGDVKPEQVFAEAEKYFGAIAGDASYKKEEFYHNSDIRAQSINIYRDIQQPTAVVAFVTPGSHKGVDAALDVIAWILGHGKGSRLYKKLVHELQLATDVDVFPYVLFDHGAFMVFFHPKQESDIPVIEKIIFDELELLIAQGPTETELERAVKNARIQHFNVLEDSRDQAFYIGQMYLATKDENNLFKYLTESTDEIKEQVMHLLSAYFRPTVAYHGAVLALPDAEKAQWSTLQEQSDEEDKKILFARERNTPVEAPVYAEKATVSEPTHFVFPHAKKEMLDNGITLLYHNNSNIPQVQIALEFKAHKYYDSDILPGLYEFMAEMMQEGTENYTSTELADAVESRGMSLDIAPGMVSIKALPQDLPFAFDILLEVVTKPLFDAEEIEKVRARMESDLRGFWDNPKHFSGQLTKELVYKKHPYGKNTMGTFDSIAKISRQDLMDFFQKYITPRGARLAIVGDIEAHDIPALVKEKLGSWQGPTVPELAYPALEKAEAREVTYPINRDQVVLIFAGLSISRMHPDYDTFLLFDQIFGGGMLGSMSSILFNLREETGLFYTINGSLLAGADLQPGMSMVKTIVSLDRLQEAEKAISKTINTAWEQVTPEDVVQARLAVVNSLTDNFESNAGMAATFLRVDRLGLPASHFDTRNADLKKVTLKGMQEAVKKALNTNQMFLLKVGRV